MTFTENNIKEYVLHTCSELSTDDPGLEIHLLKHFFVIS